MSRQPLGAAESAALPAAPAGQEEEEEEKEEEAAPSMRVSSCATVLAEAEEEAKACELPCALLGARASSCSRHSSTAEPEEARRTARAKMALRAASVDLSWPSAAAAAAAAELPMPWKTSLTTAEGREEES
jgi:hypothetical protein